MSEKNNIISRECKFVIHCGKPKHGNKKDLHLVKEIINYEDGSSERKLTPIYDFKRPYWVTKKGFRNHEEKKESEKIDRLQKYKSTQSDLVNNIANSLGEPWFNGNLRKISASPYLYGSDIKSEAIIKKIYMDKYKDVCTKNTLAVFDIETNMLDGSNDIIMASITEENNSYTVIDKKIFTEFNKRNNLSNKPEDIIRRLKSLYVKYMETYEKEKTKQNAKDWEIELVDTELSVAINCFKKAHKWQPDFVSIWNMDFDIPKVVSVLEKNRIEPKLVFSDPTVPKEYQFFKYVQGKQQKVSSSGVTGGISPANQWHSVYCPSSFYLIDSMCVYRRLRKQKAEEQSYSLDSIAEKEIGFGKLDFPEADGYEKGAWHIFMQENYLYEYTLYNLFDCKLILMLDSKTKDLENNFMIAAGYSHFSDFPSNPKMVVDVYHYYCLENNEVIGSTSSNLKTEIDSKTLSPKGWITMLPACIYTEDGYKVIQDKEVLTTNIYTDVADLDVSAAYPHGGICCNVSKRTTMKTIIELEGVEEEIVRYQSINLSGGASNATEFCTNLLGSPELHGTLLKFKELHC